ncbi:GATA-like protein [Scheffersomyces xylosifermentans]|uniref:GATA-like protein n=1 Tax=Scheffersomyces xylosifermentans TaxID=1304137 RepID=UPI00315D5749
MLRSSRIQIRPRCAIKTTFKQVSSDPCFAPASFFSLKRLSTTRSHYEQLDSTKDIWNSLISKRSGLSKTIEDTNHRIGSNAEPSNKENVTTTSNGSLVNTSFVVKDNITTTQEETTSASQMLSNYKSPFNATVVSLLSAEGSKLVGKANLDELGMGSSSTNTFYGPVINPLYYKENDDNTKHIAGGSSGGSAAAVAAKLATFSLGTDTGGSVRLPASYCGVIGFKPTYGRISRWGVVPYAQTLDTVGVLSEDINIVEKVYRVLNQYDSKDPTSLPENTRQEIITTKTSDLSFLTIGLPEEFIIEDLSEEVKEIWVSVLANLQKMGHKVKTVSIPSIRHSLSAYYTLVTAEAASNLSRYDGVRYGYSVDDIQGSAHDMIVANRTKAFGAEVQRRILLGNYTLSSDSGDHYKKATQVRERLVKEFNQVFNLPHALVADDIDLSTGKCDILLSPTSIGSPPPIEEYLQQTEENFLNAYINDILTVPASLAGLPAISLPFGNHGIQIMGQFGDDDTVLALSKSLLD